MDEDEDVRSAAILFQEITETDVLVNITDQTRLLDHLLQKSKIPQPKTKEPSELQITETLTVEEDLIKERLLFERILQLDCSETASMNKLLESKQFFSGEEGWSVAEIVRIVDAARGSGETTKSTRLRASDAWLNFVHTQQKNGNKQNKNDWALITPKETLASLFKQTGEEYNVKQAMKYLIENMFEVKSTKITRKRKETSAVVAEKKQKDKIEENKQNQFRKRQMRSSKHSRKREIEEKDDNSDDELDFMFEYSNTVQREGSYFYPTALSKWVLVAKDNKKDRTTPNNNIQSIATHIQKAVESATTQPQEIFIPSSELKKIKDVTDEGEWSVWVNKEKNDFLYRACGGRPYMRDMYQRRISYEEVKWKLVCAQTSDNIYTKKMVDVVLQLDPKSTVLQREMDHSAMLQKLQTCNPKFDLDMLQSTKPAKVGHICFHVCNVKSLQDTTFVSSTEEDDTVRVTNMAENLSIVSVDKTDQIRQGDILEARDEENNITEYVRVRQIKSQNKILLQRDIDPQHFVKTELQSVKKTEKKVNVKSLTRLVLKNTDNVLSLFYEPVSATCSQLQQCAVCGVHATGNSTTNMKQCQQCNIYTCEACDSILQNNCRHLTESDNKKMLFPVSKDKVDAKLPVADNVKCDINIALQADSDFRKMQAANPTESRLHETQNISVKNALREFVLEINGNKFVTDNNLLTNKNLMENIKELDNKNVAWFIQNNKDDNSLNQTVWLRAENRIDDDHNRHKDWIDTITNIESRNVIREWQETSQPDDQYEDSEISKYIQKQALEGKDVRTLKLELTAERDLVIDDYSFGLHTFQANLKYDFDTNKLKMTFFYSNDLRANPRLSSFEKKEIEFNPETMTWISNQEVPDVKITYEKKIISDKMTIDTSELSFIGANKEDRHTVEIFLGFEDQSEHIKQCLLKRVSVSRSDLSFTEVFDKKILQKFNAATEDNLKKYIIFQNVPLGEHKDTPTEDHEDISTEEYKDVPTKEGQHEIQKTSIVYAYNHIWSKDEILTYTDKNILCIENDEKTRYCLDNSLWAKDCSALNLRSVTKYFDSLFTDNYFEIYHPWKYNNGESRCMTSSFVKIIDSTKEDIMTTLFCTRLSLTELEEDEDKDENSWSSYDNVEIKLQAGVLTSKQYDSIKTGIENMKIEDTKKENIKQAILALNRNNFVTNMTSTTKQLTICYYIIKDDDLAHVQEDTISIKEDLIEKINAVKQKIECCWFSSDKAKAFSQFIEAQIYTDVFLDEKKTSFNDQSPITYTRNLFFKTPRKLLNVKDINTTWKMPQSNLDSVKESSVVAPRAEPAYGIKMNKNVIESLDDTKSACITLGETQVYACHPYTCTNCQDVLVLDNACQSKRTHFRTRYQYLQYLFDSRSWTDYNANHIQLTPSEEQSIFVPSSNDPGDAALNDDEEEDDQDDMHAFERMKEKIEKLHSFSVLTSAQSWCRVCANAQSLTSDASKTYIFCGEYDRIVGFQHDILLNTICERTDVTKLDQSYDIKWDACNQAMQQFEHIRQQQIQQRVLHDTLECVSEESEVSESSDSEDENVSREATEQNDTSEDLMQTATETPFLSAVKWTELEDGQQQILEKMDWESATWDAFNSNSFAPNQCGQIKKTTMKNLQIQDTYVNTFESLCDDRLVCHQITDCLIDNNDDEADAQKLLLRQMRHKVWLEEECPYIKDYEKLSKQDIEILEAVEMSMQVWNGSVPKKFVDFANARKAMVVHKKSVTETMEANDSIEDTLYKLLRINKPFWHLWFRENIETYDVYVLRKKECTYTPDNNAENKEELQKFLDGDTGAISLPMKDSTGTAADDKSLSVWQQIGLDDAVNKQGALLQYFVYDDDDVKMVNVYHTLFLNQLAVQYWHANAKNGTIESCQSIISKEKKISTESFPTSHFDKDSQMFACVLEMEHQSNITLTDFWESCRKFENKSEEFQTLFIKIHKALQKLDTAVDAEIDRFDAFVNTRVSYKFDCYWHDLTKATQSYCKACGIGREMFLTAGKNRSQFISDTLHVYKEKKKLERELQRNHTAIDFYNSFCIFKNELGLPAADEKFVHINHQMSTTRASKVPTSLQTNINNKASFNVFTQAIAEKLARDELKSVDAVVNRLKGVDISNNQDEDAAEDQEQTAHGSDGEDEGNNTDTDESSISFGSDSESDDDYATEEFVEASEYHPVIWQIQDNADSKNFEINAQNLTELVFNPKQIIQHGLINQETFMGDIVHKNTYQESLRQVLQDAADKQLYGNKMRRNPENKVDFVCDLRRIMHAVYTQYVTEDCYKNVLSAWSRKEEEIFGSCQNIPLKYYATLLSVLFVDQHVNIEPRIIHLFVKTEDGYKLREVNMATTCKNSTEEYALAEANFVRNNLHSMIDLKSQIQCIPDENNFLDIKDTQFEGYVHNVLSNETANAAECQGKIVADTKKVEISLHVGFNDEDDQHLFYSPSLQDYVNSEIEQMQNKTSLTLPSDLLDNDNNIMSKVDHVAMQRGATAKTNTKSTEDDSMQVKFKPCKTDMQQILYWNGLHTIVENREGTNARGRANADKSNVPHECAYAFDRVLYVGDFFLVTHGNQTFRLTLETPDEMLMTTSLHKFELSAKKLMEEKTFEGVETVEDMKNKLGTEIGTAAVPVESKDGHFAEGESCTVNCNHFIVPLRNIEKWSEIQNRYGKVLTELVSDKDKKVWVTRLKKQKMFKFRLVNKKQQEKDIESELVEGAKEALKEYCNKIIDQETAFQLLNNICKKQITQDELDKIETKNFQLEDDKIVICKKTTQQKMYLCQINTNGEKKIVELPEEKEQPDKNHQVFFAGVDIVPGDKQRNVLAPITINRILVNLTALTGCQYSTSEIQSVTLSESDSLIFKKHTKVYSIEDWTCTYNINQFFYCSQAVVSSKHVCPTSSTEIKTEKEMFEDMFMPDLWRWLYHILNITPSENRTDNADVNLQMFQQIFDVCARAKSSTDRPSPGYFYYDKTKGPIVIDAKHDLFEQKQIEGLLTAFCFLFGPQIVSENTADRQPGMPNQWKSDVQTEDKLQPEGLDHFKKTMSTLDNYTNKAQTEKKNKWSSFIFTSLQDESLLPNIDTNFEYTDRTEIIDEVMRSCNVAAADDHTIDTYLEKVKTFSLTLMRAEMLASIQTSPEPTTAFCLKHNEFSFTNRLANNTVQIPTCTIEGGTKLKMAQSANDLLIFKCNLWKAPTVALLHRLQILGDKLQNKENRMSSEMVPKMYQALFCELKEFMDDHPQTIGRIMDQNFKITLSNTITGNKKQDSLVCVLPFVLQRYIRKTKLNTALKLTKDPNPIESCQNLNEQSTDAQKDNCYRYLWRRTNAHKAKSEVSLLRTCNYVSDTNVKNDVKMNVLFGGIRNIFDKTNCLELKQNPLFFNEEQFTKRLSNFVTYNEILNECLPQIDDRIENLRNTISQLTHAQNSEKYFKECVQIKFEPAISMEEMKKNLEHFGIILLPTEKAKLKTTNYRYEIELLDHNALNVSFTDTEGKRYGGQETYQNLNFCYLPENIPGEPQTFYFYCPSYQKGMQTYLCDDYMIDNRLNLSLVRHAKLNEYWFLTKIRSIFQDAALQSTSYQNWVDKLKYDTFDHENTRLNTVYTSWTKMTTALENFDKMMAQLEMNTTNQKFRKYSAFSFVADKILQENYCMIKTLVSRNTQSQITNNKISLFDKNVLLGLHYWASNLRMENSTGLDEQNNAQLLISFLLNFLLLLKNHARAENKDEIEYQSYGLCLTVASTIMHKLLDFMSGNGNIAHSNDELDRLYCKKYTLEERKKTMSSNINQKEKWSLFITSCLRRYQPRDDGDMEHEVYKWWYCFDLIFASCQKAHIIDDNCKKSTFVDLLLSNLRKCMYNIEETPTTLLCMVFKEYYGASDTPDTETLQRYIFDCSCKLGNMLNFFVDLDNPDLDRTNEACKVMQIHTKEDRKNIATLNASTDMQVVITMGKKAASSQVLTPTSNLIDLHKTFINLDTIEVDCACMQNVSTQRTPTFDIQNVYVVFNQIKFIVTSVTLTVVEENYKDKIRPKDKANFTQNFINSTLKRATLKTSFIISLVNDKEEELKMGKYYSCKVNAQNQWDDNGTEKWYCITSLHWKKTNESNKILISDAVKKPKSLATTLQYAMRKKYLQNFANLEVFLQDFSENDLQQTLTYSVKGLTSYYNIVKRYRYEPRVSQFFYEPDYARTSQNILDPTLKAFLFLGTFLKDNFLAISPTKKQKRNLNYSKERIYLTEFSMLDRFAYDRYHFHTATVDEHNHVQLENFSGEFAFREVDVTHIEEWDKKFVFRTALTRKISLCQFTQHLQQFLSCYSDKTKSLFSMDDQQDLCSICTDTVSGFITEYASFENQILMCQQLMPKCSLYTSNNALAEPDAVQAMYKIFQEFIAQLCLYDFLDQTSIQSIKENYFNLYHKSLPEGKKTQNRSLLSTIAVDQTRETENSYKNMLLHFVIKLFDDKVENSTEERPTDIETCIRYLKNLFGYSFGFLTFNHANLGLPTEVDVIDLDDNHEQTGVFVKIQDCILLLIKKGKPPANLRGHDADDNGADLQEDSDDSNSSMNSGQSDSDSDGEDSSSSMNSAQSDSSSESESEEDSESGSSSPESDEEEESETDE